MAVGSVSSVLQFLREQWLPIVCADTATRLAPCAVYRLAAGRRYGAHCAAAR